MSVPLPSFIIIAYDPFSESAVKYDTRGNKSVAYINGNLSISGLS